MEVVDLFAARDAGRLPDDVDPFALTRCALTVAHGFSVQAPSAAASEALHLREKIRGEQL